MLNLQLRLGIEYLLFASMRHPRKLRILLLSGSNSYFRKLVISIQKQRVSWSQSEVGPDLGCSDGTTKEWHWTLSRSLQSEWLFAENKLMVGESWPSLETLWMQIKHWEHVTPSRAATQSQWMGQQAGLRSSWVPIYQNYMQSPVLWRKICCCTYLGN
jgi:hypothetical protein